MIDDGEIASGSRLRHGGRSIPTALVGFGGLIFVSYLTVQALLYGPEYLASRETLYSTSISGLLAGTVAAVSLLLKRSGIRSARYPRVAGWSLGVPLVLLLINLPWILSMPDLSFQEAYLWGHVVFSIGAAGGTIIGFTESRAIDRALDAERDRLRADDVERERASLEYLNSLLRHEVLNNVQVIQGQTTFIQEECSDAFDEHLSTIRAKSEDMTQVIDDVRVLISSLQSDDPFAELNLATVLGTELSKLETMHESLAVETDVPDDVRVLGDDVLPRIFRNLFENAVEHNDSASPELRVTAEETDENVLVHVADNGPGIPDEKRSALFQRTTTGNHGLGLYLVEMLVDRYDGAIELTDTGPDGTTFTVELPRAPPADTTVA